MGCDSRRDWRGWSPHSVVQPALQNRSSWPDTIATRRAVDVLPPPAVRWMTIAEQLSGVRCWAASAPADGLVKRRLTSGPNMEG